MKYIRIKDTTHDFVKSNLVTLHDRHGQYDQMKCSYCGCEGKRRDFQNVHVTNRVPNDCPKNKLGCLVGRTVQVTVCGASGGAFANLLPDSKHEVVEPPENYKNDHTGVWVMGVGEPVKLLVDEFNLLPSVPIRKRNNKK